MSRGQVEENPRTSHLLPHPWDEVGRPPAPGEAHPARSWDKQLKEINVFLSEATQREREAEEKREEAQEEEDAALEAREDAIDIIEAQIEPVDPVLAKTLKQRVNSGARTLEL